MKSIQKHEPQLVIELKSGRKLMTPAKNEQAIASDLETKRFVKIEGVTINVLEVKTMELMGVEYDILAGLTEDQRNEAVTRFKSYETNLGKKPTKQWKQNWINKQFANRNDI